ncbi:MAG: restriction endonuclease subunit S [Citrobacter sp.]|uniref:restriction endonuclease subunit S n=1 Tax=Citrobacter sp. TaxID=1896336 RepID=UPI002FC877A8
MNYPIKIQVEKVIPEGYKLTDAGVIPEDWDACKIGDISEIIRGASPRPKGDKRFYGGNIPRLMVEDVTRDGKYVTPSVDSLTEAGAKLSRPCSKGTLTLVCSGTVGVPSILAVDACIHDGFLGLSKVNKSISIDYLYHFFTTQQEKFNNSATHGGVFTNLTTDGVKEFLLALPRDKKEQTAIANVLSDIDALITELEKLIAKKQAIKTATMQQLLTGRTRLPQFSKHPNGIIKGYKPGELGHIPEDWEEREIGKFAPLQRGFDLPASKRNEGLYPVVYSNGIVNTHNHFQVKGPGVVTGRSGTLGKVHHIECDFWPHNTSLWVTKFINSDPKFVYYIFKYIGFERFASGSGVPTLNRNDAHSFKVAIPSSLKEQIIIATIFSDMDTELEALEQKLAKVRDIKQGMMQQLLTGRIRLPLDQQP